MTEPGRGGGEVERSTDPAGSYSPAVDDEQELDEPLGAGGSVAGIGPDG